MSRSLTPIKVIAADIAADIGDSVGRHQFRLMRKVLEGYRDMHLYVDQDFSVKTQILEVDNVINMPCDFVYETKVGILKDGKIAVMSLDKDLRKRKLTDTQTLNELNDIWCGIGIWDAYTFYNCFSGVDYLGEMYGFGGVYNTNGFYNINRQSGEIYIGSMMPEGAQIIVEYKSDGTSEGLELVPTEIVMALKYFAKSEYYADSNPTLSAINRANYEREYRRVKLLYNFRTALFMASEVQSYHKSSPH